MADTAAAEVETTKGKYQPSEFLKSVLGRPVVVKLNSGVDYRGVLACLDGYMNIAMEQTEEYVNGQLKAKYGTCVFVYLQCVLSISNVNIFVINLLIMSVDCDIYLFCLLQVIASFVEIMVRQINNLS
jgi:U6 snRNA-associated Sm-like protein LSm6